MPFTERTPIETGFAAVYTDTVQPSLTEFEFERKAVLKRTYLKLALLPVAAAAVIGGTYAIWGDEYMVAAIILSVMALGVTAMVLWGNAKDRWGAQVKDVAMPAICGHLGDLTYNASGSGFPVDTIRDLRLLPKYDRAALSNKISGTHDGTPFQMVHANLTESYEDNEGRTKTTTVFRGLLFRVTLPTRVPGSISLMRDRGAIGNKLAEKLAFGSTRSMPKVSFDDEPFEAAFEVYAANPDAAEALLSDDMRATIMGLGDGQGGARAFLAGFAGEAFYMALERPGSFMTMGGLTTPVTEIEEDLHRVFDDIALAFSVTQVAQTMDAAEAA